MSSLLRMARNCISIYEDVQRRYPGASFDVYDFDQTWASTALGFNGYGGAAMTTARTYVLIRSTATDRALVYFDGYFAYEAAVNDRFIEDMKRCDMASVAESGRYKK